MRSRWTGESWWPSNLLLVATASEQIGQAPAGEFQVCLPRPPGAFLERMQYVNGFFEPGHVEDPVLHGRAHSDFRDAGPDRGHWFPIARQKSRLHALELVTGF